MSDYLTSKDGWKKVSEREYVGKDEIKFSTKALSTKSDYYNYGALVRCVIRCAGTETVMESVMDFSDECACGGESWQAGGPANKLCR